MQPFKLPTHLEQFAGSNLPTPAKMITAKGTAPLQPKDLVTCVFAMSLDKDETIAKTAIKTLNEFPETFLKTAIEGETSAQVLDGLARQLKNQPIAEVITLHSQTPDATLCFLAEKGSPRIIDMISNNQSRLLKCPEILDHLGNNPMTGSAIIDRLFSFLEREGVLSIEEEAKGPEVSIDQFLADHDEIDIPDDLEFPDELMEDLNEELEEEEVRSLFAKVLNMTVTQKIKLAIKGNKEARTLLIRDPNKLVSTAVVKSPKIGDNEIVSIVGSKTISDQVLRLIYGKKEWRKIYKVQFGLATNPKTPPNISMRMLKMLRENDLKSIAKSRSVPGVIRSTAKRMIQAKQK